MAFIPDAPIAKKKSSFVPDDYSVGGFAGNVLKSAGKNALGIGESLLNVANPDMDKNTLANTARLVQGGLQKIDPTEGKVVANAIGDSTPIKYVKQIDKMKGRSTDYTPTADAVGQFYKDRYGGIENIKRSVYEDPVGVALDVSTVLTGVGGGLKGLGAVANSSKLARAGEIASTIGKVTDPLAIAGKGISKVGGSIKPKVASTLEKASEAYATSGLGNPEIIRNVKAVTGKGVGKLMREYDLFDRSLESVSRAIEKIDDVTALKIKNAPAAQVLDILEKFDEKIAELSKESILSETARGELSDLIRRKKEFVTFIGGKSSTPLEIPAETVRGIKKSVRKDIPSAKFSLDAAQTAKSNAARKAYNIFKDQVNELAGTKQLGKDEAGLIQLNKIFDKSDARGTARQLMSIKDLLAGGIGGTVGSVAGGPLFGTASTLGGIAMRQFMDSPQGIKIISDMLNNSSKAVSGAKVNPAMKNIFKQLYQGGKIERMSGN